MANAESNGNSDTRRNRINNKTWGASQTSFDRNSKFRQSTISEVFIDLSYHVLGNRGSQIIASSHIHLKEQLTKMASGVISQNTTITMIIRVAHYWCGSYASCI